MFELSILLEDGPLLAVNKPPGLSTQTPRGEFTSVESLVREYLQTKYAKPGNVYLGIPHRLDRPVSGVMVFARNSKSAARLAEQFAERQIKKIYWAQLEGRLPSERGLLTDWMRKVPQESKAELVEELADGAKEARLAFHVLHRGIDPSTQSESTLVEIELITGRMHQIRLQFAARGCPIVGDRLYGSPTEFPPVDPADERSRPIRLHARRIELLHPIRYETVTIEAPLPSDWPTLAPLS